MTTCVVQQHSAGPARSAHAGQCWGRLRGTNVYTCHSAKVWQECFNWVSGCRKSSLLSVCPRIATTTTKKVFLLMLDSFKWNQNTQLENCPSVTSQGARWRWQQSVLIHHPFQISWSHGRFLLANSALFFPSRGPLTKGQNLLHFFFYLCWFAESTENFFCTCK